MELRIRGWLDNFSFGVKRDPIPGAHFRYIVTTGSGTKVILGRFFDDLSSYILLRVEIAPTTEEKKAIEAFTSEEQAILIAQTKLELNRASIGYEGFTSLNGFAITKRIPIGHSLNEDTLIGAIGEMEAAYHVVFLTGAMAVAKRNLKERPLVLEEL